MGRAKSPRTYLDGVTLKEAEDAAREKYARWKKVQENPVDLFDTLSPQDVFSFVSQVLSDGGYVGISKTRDGGAICFTALFDKTPHKLYISSADQLEAEVAILMGMPARRP